MCNAYKKSVLFGIPEGTAFKFLLLQITFLELQLQVVGHPSATFSLANNDIMIKPGRKKVERIKIYSHPD